MALKDSSNVARLAKDVKFELQADSLKDFEREIAKVKILEAAYNHIKLVNPVDSVSFSLDFGLDW